MKFESTSAHAPAERSRRPHRIGMLVLAVVGVAAMSIADNPEVATSSTQSGVTPDHSAAEWPELPLDPAAALDPRRVALRDAGGELLAIYLTWYEASERIHADRASELPPAPRLRWRPIWTSTGMESLPQAVFTDTPIITTLSPGDADADGTVGQQDAALVLSEWGSTSAFGIRGDLNFDGIASTPDLAAVLEHWGRPGAGGDFVDGRGETAPLLTCDCDGSANWILLCSVPCTVCCCIATNCGPGGGGGGDGSGTNPGGGHEDGDEDGGGGGGSTGIGNPGSGGGGGEDPCADFGDTLDILLPTVRRIQDDPNPIPIGWVNDDDDDLDGVRDDADPELSGPLVENDLYPVEIPTSGVRSWALATANGCRVWRARPDLPPPPPVDPAVTRLRFFDGLTWQRVTNGEQITIEPGMPPQVRIEVTRASKAIGDFGMSIRFTIDQSGGGTVECIKSVTFTGLKLGVHDLRHWGPRWDPQTDQPSVENTDLRTSPEVEGGTEVQGAITDGASLCLVRLDGPDLDLGLEVRLLHNASPTSQAGSVEQIPAPTQWAVLPRLPVIESDPLSISHTAEFTGRMAFYVPPDSFPPWESADGEFVPIQIELRTLVLGKPVRTLVTRTFWLRRPPIVLVHGWASSPATWDESIWSYDRFQTRLEKVDYSETAWEGYSENWKFVPDTIELSLQRYRRGQAASPNAPVPALANLRYAAIRADVVAHSMGGILTRLYVSDFEGIRQREQIDYGLLGGHERKEMRGRWPAFVVVREESTPPRNRNFLKNSNFGAGTIRRFVTIGSPFDGSAWADVVRRNWPLKEAAKATINRLKNPRETMHDLLRRARYQGLPGGFTVEPTPSLAMIDLGPDSTAQRVLDAAFYQFTDRKRVRWHPIVGLATQEIPASIVRESLWAITLGIPTTLTNGAAATANGTDGDLVVLADSQSNGQLELTNPVGTVREPVTSTVHAAFPGMENFGVLAETSSTPIADYVRRLLRSGYDPNDWNGDLTP